MAFVEAVRELIDYISDKRQNLIVCVKATLKKHKAPPMTASSFFKGLIDLLKPAQTMQDPENKDDGLMKQF